jgi:hypothetical protein
MEFRKGPTLDEFCEIVQKISDERYDSNVIVGDSETLSKNGTTFRATLRVKDSKKFGARTSSRGRHTPAASWEAFRDVLREVFDRWPNTYVSSMLVFMLGLYDPCEHRKASGEPYRRHKERHRRRGYNGKAQFEEMYPETAAVNWGSQIYWACLPDLSIER